MSIELFEHNKTAYESAVAMLASTGKAAIIHPTGTGKSFIAFKLCEDNPESRICWLSPSAYIFETQLENLKSVANGWQPENISFFTYSKLMGISDEEIAEIQPDYIILYEFHRAGADIWGQGVKKLLVACPAAQILALLATSIRYLDNQCDMSDELFDGNVASEMTLGEAIVRGILSVPKYVLSVFSYQKDLDRYKACVKRAKSKLIRDEAKIYLEALRRALEKADGLDVIFAKHMNDRTGKYIFFCANKEHMDEMIDHVPEWFGKIDAKPHIYSVYSDDPSASKSFADFKTDNDADHLKLLFCIDALNEGIHVDNVSGVILLRPTVSPIIYKQQIGRALAAGKKSNLVIFDIVLNIENLYSIGAIEEEMKIAMTYYRSLGEPEEIVNEHYKYKTADGYSLGHWMLTQKRVRTGDTPGILSAERIEKLDSIGMVWNGYRDLAWERNFEAAKEYYNTFENLNVVASYVTETGVGLGSWIARLRVICKNKSQQRYLTKERIEALDEIGMVWDVADHLWQQYYGACLTYYHTYGNLDIPLKYNADQIERLNSIGMTWKNRSTSVWEKHYSEAKKYFESYGNLLVPASYLESDGKNLSRWITAQRGYFAQGNLTWDQIDRLSAIGMVWKFDDPWETGFTHAKSYYESHGNLLVHGTYVCPVGYALGSWILKQRSNYAKPDKYRKVSPTQKKRLDEIGMVWSAIAERWEAAYALAEEYWKEHGDLRVPTKYKAPNGYALDEWVRSQREKKAAGTLTQEQIDRLDAIGMDWLSPQARLWETRFEICRAYYEEHGNLDMPTTYVTDNGMQLGLWLWRIKKEKSS